MSWRTNSLALSLRNMGRRYDLNSFLMSFVSSSSYEDKFNKALLSCVKRNDVVWDVGANIGHYTRLFADLTGSQGTVFAFEPSPQNYKRLVLNIKGVENVVLLPYGLGNKEETVAFKQGDDELGATSQVLGVTASTGEHDQVEIRVGDLLVQSGSVKLPNFVKIDVEGFELEVLAGMREILNSHELRALGIEVHFGLLTARGMAHAPQKIESLLREAGFSCSWPDSSHILATRTK
ncbi:MAG TPA: FkbM family methyltransferase [Bacteriovoracaceae bacterium]|nr:FkbM family methyltransferase [Bacteriovoracaceae bacterium]